jgi:hypothetical protein
MASVLLVKKLKQSKLTSNQFNPKPPKMRPLNILLFAGPALSNIVPRQATPSSITRGPPTASVEVVIAATLPLGQGPFASLDSIPGCSLAPSIRRLLDSAPRPGSKLRAEIGSASVSDFCAFAPTATVLSVDYSQYTSELVTWYHANSAALGSFQASFTSSCTVAGTAITSAVLACVSQIKQEASGVSAGATAGVTTTAGMNVTNVTSTVSGTASTASTAGAAEATGLAGAAGIVAGLMGIMVFL